MLVILLVFGWTGAFIACLSSAALYLSEECRLLYFSQCVLSTGLFCLHSGPLLLEVLSPECEFSQ